MAKKTFTQINIIASDYENLKEMSKTLNLPIYEIVAESLKEYGKSRAINLSKNKNKWFLISLLAYKLKCFLECLNWLYLFN